VIHVGDGKNTPFWEARWLDRAALKDLPLNLYKVARFKQRFVSTGLHRSNWIRSLTDIADASQMEEFTLLFMALSSVTLTDQPDSITWKWTSNGVFSLASSYECQFLGTFVKFPTQHVWKCLAEPKSRFFTWLVLHDMVLTAENLAKRN
jgi:hypothetical protein